MRFLRFFFENDKTDLRKFFFSGFRRKHLFIAICIENCCTRPLSLDMLHFYWKIVKIALALGDFTLWPFIILRQLGDSHPDSHINFLLKILLKNGGRQFFRSPSAVNTLAAPLPEPENISLTGARNWVKALEAGPKNPES